MRPLSVLSTKHLDDNVRTNAIAAGLQLIEHDFIQLEYCCSTEDAKKIMMLSGAGQTPILFTSQHAVKALSAMIAQTLTEVHTSDWKICCLSGKTLQAIQSDPVFGHGHITAVADDASGLAEQVIRMNLKSVVFPCGDKRKDTIPDILSAASIQCDEFIVYRNIATPKKIDTDTIDAALFFSPSAAESFFSCNELPPTAVCFAIGDTTALAVAALTEHQVFISETPTQDNMLQLVLNTQQQLENNGIKE